MKRLTSEAFGVELGERADRIGRALVAIFHYVALFAIGATTLWSAGATFISLLAKSHASINDILLLFIYLELGAMVGIYFRTNHLPVRFLIYIAITALTRLLIEDISAHHELSWGVVRVSGAILLLSVATLVIRFASARFPARTESETER
jgi:phosphate starvation-inducible membrane PsiE